MAITITLCKLNFFHKSSKKQETEEKKAGTNFVLLSWSRNMTYNRTIICMDHSRLCNFLHAREFKNV